MRDLLNVESLTISYRTRDHLVTALLEVSLTLAQGERLRKIDVFIGHRQAFGAGRRGGKRPYYVWRKGRAVLFWPGAAELSGE